MMDEDDTLPFLEEVAPKQPSADCEKPWRILVVDDDPDVHSVTAMVLKNFLVLGRPLAMISAYSGQEALHLLNRHSSELPALVLMDVVMDSPTDGIDTVHKIRSELNLREIPYVIMRTGQSGTSFELHDLKVDRDIDFVVQKSQLSSESLREAVTFGLTVGRDKDRLGINA